jgi:3-hydroxyacyl-CoA dehydrogenase/enoyl-CoA hydratase/3-hydroxybutyryl-CoA epimerase
LRRRKKIESRYFLSLVLNPISKSMINTFWFQMNEVKIGASRPEGFERANFKKVGVLGAGMMGAGIAYACMNKGIQVVLKDVSQESADKGKTYSENLLAKKLKRGFIDEEKMQAALSLITATDNADELKDCDMIVEAVFEDQELKAGVTKEAEAQMLASGVFASNTSTLPITGLAKASVRPEQFIGLHFFSPVDKMPLVEIIVGEQTSDETLARSYDFVQQIGKTPIVVNDSRGFFTSRVFSTFIMEGLAMLGEGQPPAAIERAATLSGMPTGPLAILDEVTLVLPIKIDKQTRMALEAAGEPYQEHAGMAVIHKMVEEFERQGKSYGKGFYEYPADSKKHLWPGLSAFDSGAAMLDFQGMQDRLVYIQSLETVRCMQEGVLNSSRDANIGSIMGIGFAPQTGGAIQYINMVGLDKFITRAKQLEKQYGERFAAPQLLLDKAAKGEKF